MIKFLLMAAPFVAAAYLTGRDRARYVAERQYEERFLQFVIDVAEDQKRRSQP